MNSSLLKYTSLQNETLYIVKFKGCYVYKWFTPISTFIFLFIVCFMEKKYLISFSVLHFYFWKIFILFYVPYCNLINFYFLLKFQLTHPLKKNTFFQVNLNLG